MHGRRQHGPGPGPGPPPPKRRRATRPRCPSAADGGSGAKAVCRGPSAPCAPASARRPWPPCGGPWRRPAVAPGLRLPPAAAPPRRGGPRPGLLARPVGACRGPPLRRRPRPPSAALRRRLRASPARSPVARPGSLRSPSPRSGRPGGPPALCSGSLRPPGRLRAVGPPGAAPPLRSGLRAPGLRPPALGRARALAGPLSVRSRAGGLGLGFRRLQAAGAGTTWLTGFPGVCVWFGPCSRGAWGAVPVALYRREIYPAGV